MENLINLHLGQKLKTLRKRSSKSQVEMALLFDIEQQSYWKLENGKTNFSAHVQQKIHEIFGLTPLDFLYSSFGREHKQENPNENYINNLIFNQFRRQILELRLRNTELEIEVRKYRKNFIVGEDGPPVHVIF